MDDDASVELEIVLGTGIELGTNVIAFGTHGKALVKPIVRAAAELRGKGVFAARSRLRIDMDATDERVSPGRQPAGADAPTDANASGVESVFRSFAVEHFRTPSGNHVSFHAQPIRKVVRKVGVQPAQIGGKGSRLKMNKFVADAQGEFVEIAIGSAKLRGRSRGWKGGLRGGQDKLRYESERGLSGNRRRRRKRGGDHQRLDQRLVGLLSWKRNTEAKSERGSDEEPFHLAILQERNPTRGAGHHINGKQDGRRLSIEIRTEEAERERARWAPAGDTGRFGVRNWRRGSCGGIAASVPRDGMKRITWG